MSENEPTQNIDSFLGLRNREQPRRMQPGSLTVAENVDIDDLGGVIKRQGYSLSLTSTKITSSFSTQDERRLFVIDNGDLKIIQEDFSAIVLLSGFSDDYVWWLEVADFIIMSTGHIIDKDNNVVIFRIPNPVQPNVSIVNGDLRKGQYQIVCTHVDVLGREGGASDVIVVDVEDESLYYDLDSKGKVAPLPDDYLDDNDDNGKDDFDDVSENIEEHIKHRQNDDDY